jgi:hypothetical protein
VMARRMPVVVVMVLVVRVVPMVLMESAVL